jgi:hypothetical protein
LKVRAFLFFLFYFLYTEISSAQLISIREKVEGEVIFSDSLFIDQDSIAERVVTKVPLTIYFYNTIVFLNWYDTVMHYTSTSRNYVDQFLTIHGSEKILPASKIYGYFRNGAYYRSGSMGNGRHVFAKRIQKGKMNLFSADKFHSVDEIDVIGSSRDGIYNNRILVQDANRNKLRRNSKDYFFTIHDKADTLQLFTPTEKTVYMLQDKKVAAEYVKLHLPKSGYRTLRVASRYLFFSSGLATAFIGHRNDKDLPVLLGITGLTGILFIGTSIYFQVPSWKDVDVLKTVALYNEEN